MIRFFTERFSNADRRGSSPSGAEPEQGLKGGKASGAPADVSEGVARQDGLLRQGNVFSARIGAIKAGLLFLEVAGGATLKARVPRGGDPGLVQGGTVRLKVTAPPAEGRPAEVQILEGTDGAGLAKRLHLEALSLRTKAAAVLRQMQPGWRAAAVSRETAGLERSPAEGQGDLPAGSVSLQDQLGRHLLAGRSSRFGVQTPSSSNLDSPVFKALSLPASPSGSDVLTQGAMFSGKGADQAFLKAIFRLAAIGGGKEPAGSGSTASGASGSKTGENPAGSAGSGLQSSGEMASEGSGLQAGTRFGPASGRFSAGLMKNAGTSLASWRSGPSSQGADGSTEGRKSPLGGEAAGPKSPSALTGASGQGPALQGGHQVSSPLDHGSRSFHLGTPLDEANAPSGSRPAGERPLSNLYPDPSRLQQSGLDEPVVTRPPFPSERGEEGARVQPPSGPKGQAGPGAADERGDSWPPSARGQGIGSGTVSTGQGAAARGLEENPSPAGTSNERGGKSRAAASALESVSSSHAGSMEGAARAVQGFVEAAHQLQALVRQELGLGLILFPLFMAHGSGVGTWAYWEEGGSGHEEGSPDVVAHIAFDLTMSSLGLVKILVSSRGGQGLDLSVGVEKSAIGLVRQEMPALAQRLKDLGFGFSSVDLFGIEEKGAEPLISTLADQEGSGLHVMV